MNAIASLNTTSGQSIHTILPPTFKIFSPLILANKAAIKAIPSTEVSYGTHPRQKLDVFPCTTNPSTSPIIIFLHGGGLIRGDKNSNQAPEDLVYANVGVFFASRGFTALNMNYRRVNSKQTGGGEDAVFPSGGEDVAAALKWVEGEYGGKGVKRDVYLLGNSGGGVHASTFVLSPKFEEQRKGLVSGEKGVVLKGLIDLAVPCHYKNAEKGREEALKNYYGDEKEVNEKSVYGLLEAVKASGKKREQIGVPKCLAILGEFDPAEIGGPMEDFVSLWKSTFGEGIEFVKIEGHNHISPPMALMSGDKKGEKWGEDVVSWIKKQS